MALQFTNAFVYEQFGLQTEAFARISFLFVNSASSDKHNGGHLSYTNTMAAIYFKTEESIKFVNQVPLSEPSSSLYSTWFQ